MGFEGFVFPLHRRREMILHGFAKDGRDATRLSLLAGVDMSMQSGLYRKHFPLVRSGDGRKPCSTSRCGGCCDEGDARIVDDPFRRIDEKRERTRSSCRSTARCHARRPQVDRAVEEEAICSASRSGKRIALIARSRAANMI